MKTSSRNPLSPWIPALILAIASTAVRAVDPLPPELENAPAAAKSAYWERNARDSHRQKIQVGKDRYLQGQIVKAEILETLKGEADACRETARISPTHSGQVVTPEPVGSPYGWVLFMGVTIAVYFGYKHWQSNVETAE